ncbi:MAG: thioredoxin family protein, partial [Alphaproteobacteria bacterium]|nr:thioredoxin family protein [Alphaproteobacteria bacterium]
VLLSINIVQSQKAYIKKQTGNLSERLIGVDKALISEKISAGKSVLLEIKADWCLTCQYNQAMVLTNLNLENWRNNYNMEVMTVDWTDYNREVLDFMEKYGRKGLPFYILFTPVMRDGIVLPELFTADDITSMLVYSGKI